MSELPSRENGRIPSTEVVIPCTAVPRRKRDRDAIDSLVEEGVCIGDVVIFLLPDGWTQETGEDETRWFDPHGTPRLRLHAMAEHEALGPIDQPGERVLTPLTRYFSRFDESTRRYEFVDRVTDEVLLGISANSDETHFTEDGFDMSVVINSLRASRQMHDWITSEFPNWQDPGQYWD